MACFVLGHSGPKGDPGGDGSSDAVGQNGTDIARAGSNLRRRIAQAAGILKGLDQQAKLTKQAVPQAGSLLDNFSGLLMTKPSKHDGVAGGFFWRLSAVHWQLGRTGGLSEDPAIAVQVQAVKAIALTGKIHDDILKLKKSADEGLGKSAKTLWSRNEKPASIALDAFRKESSTVLQKATSLLEEGLKAYGSAQRDHMQGLPSAAQEASSAPGRKAKAAGEGKGGLSRDTTAASAKANSDVSSGRGNAPDPAATKKRAELALKRHRPGGRASPLALAVNSAPKGILAAAAAAPKFNCKEEDKVVEEICLPPFDKTCQGQFPCTVEAHVIYTECRTRCGQDICTNTTERMGLFRQCENAWRKEYARCLKLPDDLQDACHMDNEDKSQSCIKRSGPNCKLKIESEKCPAGQVRVEIDSSKGLTTPAVSAAAAPVPAKPKCVTLCADGSLPDFTGECLNWIVRGGAAEQQRQFLGYVKKIREAGPKGKALIEALESNKSNDKYFHPTQLNIAETAWMLYEGSPRPQRIKVGDFKGGLTAGFKNSMLNRKNKSVGNEIYISPSALKDQSKLGFYIATDKTKVPWTPLMSLLHEMGHAKRWNEGDPLQESEGVERGAPDAHSSVRDLINPILKELRMKQINNEEAP